MDLPEVGRLLQPVVTKRRKTRRHHVTRFGAANEAAITKTKVADKPLQTEINDLAVLVADGVIGLRIHMSLALWNPI